VYGCLIFLVRATCCLITIPLWLTQWCRVILVYTYTYGGTRWRNWLRHRTTSRKVARSTPDDVVGMFRWHNPFGRTMALGSTQPLREISTRNVSWGGGQMRPVRTSDNLTTFMHRLSTNLGASTFWNPQGLSRTLTGLLHLWCTYIFKILLLDIYQVSFLLLPADSHIAYVPLTAIKAL
jgi:hypothetical protein